MRHILTPLALLTLGGVMACSPESVPVEAVDADLAGVWGEPPSDWCTKNGYKTEAECQNAWDTYNYNKYLSGETTERTSDEWHKTLRYGGAPGGTKQVSTQGGTTVDDIDPDDFLHEWGIGMYGQQLDPFTLALVDQFDPNMFHTVVMFDQPTEIYAVSQHEAFDLQMQPLGFSELLVHTNHGIYELNDAVTPIMGMQFFVHTQW